MRLADDGDRASGAHLHQHGTTAPKLLESILGVKARGDQGCGRFNPRTNKGHRRATLGKYHDAIHVKRHLVTPVIVETTGAIHHMAIHRLHVLKRRARGAPKNDRTRYGRSSLSTRSFVSHHSQQISAAVLGDASRSSTIHKLKRRAYLCAASAPAVAAERGLGRAPRSLPEMPRPAHALVNVVHTG